MIDYTGENPPTPIKLNIERDTDWFEMQVLTHSNYIFTANGIPKDLAGFERSKGSLNSQSGEFILQQFKMTDLGVIRPMQTGYAEYWNDILKVMGEFAGVSDMEGVGVQFPRKITQMIKESLEIDNLIDARTNNNTDKKGGEENSETEPFS